MKLPLRLTLVMVLGLASVAAAQFGGGAFRATPKFPTADSFCHGFNFCRGMYTSGRREAGGQGWSTDYPDAERNFSIRLGELTKVRVSHGPGEGMGDGEPDFLVVELTSEALFQCPYLHMEDVGTAAFTAPEVEGLRSYLLKGGFLWVDDYWGTYAWDNWVEQISKVLPAEEFPIRDIPVDHPIFHTVFDVKAVPQIPSIQVWRTGDGGTSERGSDSAEVHFRGIYDRAGNLMVVMTHNTDISDAWEREGEDPAYFYSYSPAGYQVGVNVIVYALTH